MATSDEQLTRNDYTLTYKDVAKRLQKGLRTVQRYVNDKQWLKPKTVHVGTAGQEHAQEHLFFSESEVEELKQRLLSQNSNDDQPSSSPETALTTKEFEEKFMELVGGLSKTNQDLIITMGDKDKELVTQAEKLGEYKAKLDLLEKDKHELDKQLKDTKGERETAKRQEQRETQRRILLQTIMLTAGVIVILIGVAFVALGLLTRT